MITRRWVRVCSLSQLEPGRGVAALVGEEQVAIFLLPGTEGEKASRIRAVDNRDPASGVNVLARGLVGSTADADYVASPMYKHRFDLATGRCLDGEGPTLRVWPVRVWGATVEVLATGVREEPPDPAVSTHCPYCALQCAMAIRAGEGGAEIAPQPRFPVNQGRMCVKGWSSVELLRHRDRLLHPLVRDASGRQRQASWDSALDELAGRLNRIRADHGPHSIGVFGSGALTNEKAYLLGKFARVAIGTANIDYNGRFCMASAAAAQNRAFGLDRGLPFPLSDVAETDTLVLWGCNPADTMPPFMQWVDRLRARRGRLVVVDPRRTATAALADLHLQPVPGTDLAVALGLLHLAVRRGMVDQPYIKARTTGWDAVRRSVEGWTPDRVHALADVLPSDLEAVAAALQPPGRSILITGRGPEQQTKGVDTVSALINLMLALGQVGRPAGGYGCLTGQGNGQGGREHGQKADQLPGYRLIGADADRAAVARVWGVDPASLPGPGQSAVEMLQGIGTAGGIRALLVAGSNLPVASPDAGSVAEKLARLDLLAVLDAFPNQTTDLAAIVLPVTQWAEEDGTITNLEGRVLRRRKALDPPPGVKSDLEVLAGLAARLGLPAGFGHAGPEAVFDELRRASAGARADYSGITYQRLDTEPGIFWPCPAPGHPGTPRLFADHFSHPDGRARLVPVDYRPAYEEPDQDYPIRLATGRWREHYNSGNQTRRVRRLREARPEPGLEMHPETAARLGLSPGSPVVVESRRGRATLRLSVDASIRPDTVFAPFHWGGEGSVNQVTVAAVDPVSRMPEFKVCAVRVRPAGR